MKCAKDGYRLTSRGELISLDWLGYIDTIQSIGFISIAHAMLTLQKITHSVIWDYGLVFLVCFFKVFPYKSAPPPLSN